MRYRLEPDQTFHIQIQREDATFEVEINAEMTYAGAPQRGPSYSSGGEPAEGPEWELEFTCGREPFVPTDMEYELMYEFVAENWQHGE